MAVGESECKDRAWRYYIPTRLYQADRPTSRSRCEVNSVLEPRDDPPALRIEEVLHQQHAFDQKGAEPEGDEGLVVLWHGQKFTGLHVDSRRERRGSICLAAPRQLPRAAGNLPGSCWAAVCR